MGGWGPSTSQRRFFLAAAVLTLIVPLVGAGWPRGRTQRALVGWVGLVLFAADYGLIYWEISASTAA